MVCGEWGMMMLFGFVASFADHTIYILNRNSCSHFQHWFMIIARGSHTYTYHPDLIKAPLGNTEKRHFIIKIPTKIRPLLCIPWQTSYHRGWSKRAWLLLEIVSNLTPRFTRLTLTLRALFFLDESSLELDYMHSIPSLHQKALAEFSEITEILFFYWRIWDTEPKRIASDSEFEEGSRFHTFGGNRPTIERNVCLDKGLETFIWSS